MPPFSPNSNFFRAFKFAFKGLVVGFGERSLRFHAVALVLVVVLGFVLQVTAGEWCLLLLCIGLVVSAELMNTAIERLTDLVSPGFNEKAGQVKDLAAGAVLAASIVAAVVGALIFGKHLLALLS